MSKVAELLLNVTDIQDVVVNMETEDPKKTGTNKSLDDTVKRVITNAFQFKVRRRLEQKKRRRQETLYLVGAVMTMILIAMVLVGIRVALTGLPDMKSGAQRRPIPKYQYTMDWDPDFPESVVTERKIGMLCSSVYSWEYWLHCQDSKL